MGKVSISGTIPSLSIPVETSVDGHIREIDVQIEDVEFTGWFEDIPPTPPSYGCGGEPGHIDFGVEPSKSIDELVADVRSSLKDLSPWHRLIDSGQDLMEGLQEAIDDHLADNARTYL